MTDDQDALTPRARLTRLSAALGFAAASQVWGIVNANGTRLAEFVSYFEHEPLNETEAFEVAGLIVASANEVLLEDPDADVGWATDAARSRVAGLILKSCSG